MVIVKCKRCSKEFQLKFTENYKNYQCDCGGDLRTLSFKEIGEMNKRQNKEFKSLKSNKDEVRDYNSNFINCKITEYSTGTFGGENPHIKNGTARLKDNQIVLNKNKGFISSSREIIINYKDIINLKFKNKGMLSSPGLKIYTNSKKYSVELDNEIILHSFYNKLKDKINECF